MSLAPPAPPRPGGPGPERARLVLVRHGEPRCAVDGLIGGPRGDTGLTERGREQVRRVAARLAASKELGEVAALYASTLPRAKETAEVLAPALGGLVPILRADLREHDPGELDGRPWAEVLAEGRWPDVDADPEAPLAPNGESLVAFHERARTALRALAAAHPRATVVVACHGGVVAAAVGLALGLDVRRRLLLPTRYASMTELKATPASFELARYNDRFPLTEDDPGA